MSLRRYASETGDLHGGADAREVTWKKAGEPADEDRRAGSASLIVCGWSNDQRTGIQYVILRARKLSPRPPKVSVSAPTPTSRPNTSSE